MLNSFAREVLYWITMHSWTSRILTDDNKTFRGKKQSLRALRGSVAILSPFYEVMVCDLSSLGALFGSFLGESLVGLLRLCTCQQTVQGDVIKSCGTRIGWEKATGAKVSKRYQVTTNLPIKSLNSTSFDTVVPVYNNAGFSQTHPPHYHEIGK